MRGEAGAYIVRARDAIPWRQWVELGLGVLPAIVSFFAYNQVRFGTPFESGYALATLPDVPRGGSARSACSRSPTSR